MQQTALSYLTTADAGAIRMTSREIADLVELRHDNVKRTIKTLADRQVIQLPQIEEVRNNQSLSPNSKAKAYIFEGDNGKRDSIIVVAQLSPEFTAALVDRWQDLERLAAGQQPQPTARAFGSTGEPGLDRRLDREQAVLERAGIPKGEAMARMLRAAIALDVSASPPSDTPRTMDTPAQQAYSLLVRHFDFSQAPTQQMTATEAMEACGVQTPGRSLATSAGAVLTRINGQGPGRSSRGNVHWLPPMKH